MEKEIIFGAPGCGKTKELVDRLKEVLKVYPPNRIALVSFTKKGAHEILTRALDMFEQYSEDDFPYARTLHSICFRELKLSKYDMLSKKDYKAFSLAMNMNFIGYYTEEFYHIDDRYLYLYFLKHNNYTMYQKIRDATQVNIKTLEHVASNYNKYKEKYKKYDFTDILKNTLKAKISLDIDVVLIDEAQDLTTLQWQVCEQLFLRVKKMYIAGDDDQAIYEWTGADVNYFLNIKGKRTILKTSWRLKSNLLDFAKKISAKIDIRIDKDFKAYEEGGNIYFYNTIQDFEFKDNETYFCLSRNNYFLKRYATELRRQLKLFTQKGIPAANPELIHAINSFNDFKKGKLLDKDVAVVTKYLRKDIKNLHLLTWFEALRMAPFEAIYYRQLIQNKIKIVPPKIEVNTIHGVKGGEADNVILFMDVTKVVYDHVYALSDSELRCLYVACTRAKNNLHIIHADTKHSYANIFKELTNECDF
jgi:superfamily I DNA/RNA helicase